MRRARARSTCMVFAATMAIAGVASAQSVPVAPEAIAVGDWQVAPTLELRTRGEYRRDPVDIGGRDVTGTDTGRVRDAWNVLGRARLGVGAERGALKAQITLQDASAWGSPVASGILAPSRPAYSLVGAYEAWAEARTASARPWFLRVGRQALTWGEGRLVGSADWSPAGRSLDAIRAHAPIGIVDVEMFAAILDSPAPLGVEAADTFGPTRAGAQLYGAQGTWAIDPLLKVELTVLARVSRGSRLALDESRFSLARDAGETYTGSLRVSGDAKGWKYGVEGAYQLGRIAGGAFGPDGVDRRAFAGAAHVSRTFDTVWLTPTARIGGSYASGDDGASGTYKQFDPILPDVHAWHGAMDVFAWSNLVEGHASLWVAPWIDTSLGVEWRYARLADSHGDWIGGYAHAIGSAPQPSSEDLGHEIDGGFRWRPWTPVELSAGYSVLILGDGARSILAAQGRGSRQLDGSYAPASLAHYTYLQAKLNVP